MIERIYYAKTWSRGKKYTVYVQKNSKYIHWDLVLLNSDTHEVIVHKKVLKRAAAERELKQLLQHDTIKTRKLRELINALDN